MPGAPGSPFFWANLGSVVTTFPTRLASKRWTRTWAPAYNSLLTMTADQYLHGILLREAVDAGPNSPLLGVQTTLMPTLRQWAGDNDWLLATGF